MKNFSIKLLKNVSLTALLMVSAMFTACSSSDEILNEQSANPTESQVYTMTVQVSKSTGDDTTRGLYFDGSALKVKWNAGEKVEVWQFNANGATSAWLYIGTVTAAASDNAATTLTGNLKDFQMGNPLLFYLHTSDMSYKEQSGVLLKSQGENSIEENYDFATSGEITSSNYTVDGEKVTVTGVTLNNYPAIVKFTLEDALTGNPVKATSLKIVGSKYMYESLSATTGAKVTKELTVTPTSGTDVIYVSLFSQASNNITLTATTDDGTYTYQKSAVTFTEGKYYEVKVKMLPEGAVNLATLTDDYVAKDGDVLTGKLGSAHKISIADGATVTLHNVSINADGANTSANYAGITCLGNATIKLEGTNIVKGFKDDYPGIQAGTTNKTLIIQGTDADKLTASCNGIRSTGACGIGGLDEVACGNIVIEGGNITVEAPGAGIGGGSNTSCGDITIKGGIVNATRTSLMVGIGAGAAGTCGNITIEGGTVTATGHFDGAGIGAATVGTCGDITISGGTVVATGSTKAAGIGTGFHSSHCGNITITTGVTSVTATKGSNATYCIGIDAGKTITIGGTQYYDGTNWASTELENALKVSVFQYPSAPPSGNDVNATMDGTFTEEEWQP